MKILKLAHANIIQIKANVFYQITINNMQYKIKRTGEITDALGVWDLRTNEYTEVKAESYSIEYRKIPTQYAFFIERTEEGYTLQTNIEGRQVFATKEEIDAFINKIEIL